MRDRAHAETYDLNRRGDFPIASLLKARAEVLVP